MIENYFEILGSELRTHLKCIPHGTLEGTE